MFRNALLSFFLIVGISQVLNAQDTSKLYFTTSIGLLSPKGNFGKSYKTSLALNSGIELMMRHSFFTQFVLDFNAVNYDQQLKDNNSGYLFQHTSSSIFQAGINFGRSFYFGRHRKVFSSLYAGAGYINVGEPRLTVNTVDKIVEQDVTRMKGLFEKGGVRIGYKTNSKFLQTIYIDGSYWTTNLMVQQSRARAVSLYIGTRIGF
jgi:hypothetical protein